MTDMQGRIIKGIGGFYYVKTADDTVFECKARGVFRKQNVKLMVGDIVEISTDGAYGNIEKIEPRKNELIRPSVANIDSLVIVITPGEPEPNLFLVDKLLVNAEAAGISPVICINKTDIKPYHEIEEIYKTALYPVIAVCAKSGDGLSVLIEHIKGKISAFAGLSGVGKSTILSLITSGDMETGAVSEKIKRGRHTTRHVELLELLAGGYVFDTPGFSSFEVESVSAGDLAELFPEMKSEIGKCRFGGCSHINEPDCAVKGKLAAGLISDSRYESYIKIYEKLKNIKEWEQ